MGSSSNRPGTSRFTVRWARGRRSSSTCGQSGANSEVNKARSLPAQPRSQTILAVEDDELLLESVGAMLREQGYRVLAAPNGEAALQLLDAVEDVHLLFADLGLAGGMSGRQIADEAQPRRPGLLVLFTTGYTRNSIIHQGRLDPGVEFISKPFTHAALVAKIDQLLQRAA